MFSSFAAFVRKITVGFSEIGGWLLAFMAVLIFVDVICRYFFNSPISSVYEVSEQILMVGFIFFAIASSHHIDITLLVSRYRGRLKKFVFSIRYGLTMAFLGLLTWQSAKSAYLSFEQQETSTAILTYPIYPARMTLVLGFGLLILVELAKFIKVLRSEDVPNEH